MSEHKQEKWLYTFSIDKEVEVEKQEEQVVNGETVKVTRKVKEKKPVLFALKRPTRRMYEDADLFYGVKLSEGIRAGLLTKALLLKRYRNDGGALSDADAAYFQELALKLNQLEEEHQRIFINLNKEPEDIRLAKLDDILKQKMKTVQALQTLEAVNQALFAHTAETKAQLQLTNWWIVHLAHWDKDTNNTFTEFFPGKTFEERMAQWDTFDEQSQPFVIEALARFSLLIGLWTAGAQTKEDFEQGEKDFGSIAEKAVEDIKKEAKETTPAPTT